MKYEMPVFQESIKDAVIAWNLIEKERLEAMGDDKSSRYISVCITLASLTSLPADFSKGFEPFRHFLYTAPPVPALKSIDLSELTKVSLVCDYFWYTEDVRKAIRAAGYEVKG